MCAYGGGEVFVPNNHKMAALGVADSDEAGRAYFEFVAAGFADPVLQRKLLASMKPAVEYFEQQAGVPWNAVEGLPDYYYPDAPGSVGSARYLCSALGPGRQQTLPHRRRQPACK